MSRKHRPLIILITSLLGCGVICCTGCSSPSASSESEKAAPKPVALTVKSPTEGYVPDLQCRECHQELYESYQQVGMAQSFYPADGAKLIEDFENNHYYHELSDQHYEMLVRDGKIVQRRYQLDESEQRINELEVEADYIVGSGNHVRSYLYQTPAGELFQMPLAWYSTEQKWRMNPGYDLANHSGYQRKITRECMFCHNAYPLDVAGGSDRLGEPFVFPDQLPHGIGCQRCHGPGEEHIRLANRVESGDQQILDSIVNPANLSDDLQSDVCYQCHLQPSSQMLSLMVHFDRSEYSFRPGESLSDYRVVLDYEDSEADQKERFEINHHPYRMRQSRCFVESDGAMNCLTCHDPHRKVAKEDRVAHYRARCITCHDLADCETAVAEDIRLRDQSRDGHIAQADCVSCHMPTRRTHDVVHAIMTDHKIVADIEAEDVRLAPRREPKPLSNQLEVFSYDPDRFPPPPNFELYEAIAGADARSNQSLQELGDQIQRQSKTPLQPLLEFATTLGDRGHAPAKADVLSLAVQQHPQRVQANLEFAMALDFLGQSEQAIPYYRRALKIGPPLPEAHLGLGTSLLQRNDVAGAEEHFREAVRLRPLYPEALLNLGIVLFAQQKWEESRELLLRARAADPSFTEADLYLKKIPDQESKNRNAP